MIPACVLETKINASVRQYTESMVEPKQNMVGLAENMREAAADVTSDLSISGRLKAEVQVVVRRHSWLQAVLVSDSKRLRDLIDSAMKGGQADQQHQSDSSSTDGALAQAGPCHNLCDLRVFSFMEQHKAVIKAATSKDNLKQKMDAMKPLQKVYQNLVGSYKVALSDLVSAKATLKAADEERQREDERKQKDNAKTRKSGPQGGHGMQMPCLHPLDSQ